MNIGTIVRIKVGSQKGKRADVIGTTARAVTVRGAFGVAIYLLSEVEAVS